jgi:hypothetical protein
MIIFAFLLFTFYFILVRRRNAGSAPKLLAIEFSETRQPDENRDCSRRKRDKKQARLPKKRSASGVAINSSVHSIQRKTVGFVFVREKDRAAQASILSSLVPGKTY